MQSHLPNPMRLRKIPAHFSWIDHRLVRDHHFQRCSCNALAMYLFLLTVADVNGISYYSGSNMMKQLKLSPSSFDKTRAELIQAGLIAYQSPLYQVLDIQPVRQPIQEKSRNNRSGTEQLIKMKNLLKQISCDGEA